MITSLQNERVKRVYALQTQAKTRRKEGKIALEGTRLIRDALDSGGTLEFALYDPDAADAVLLEHLTLAKLPLLEVSGAVMQHISATEQPQGMVAVFERPDTPLPPQPACVLVLDGIHDPGNLGTMLRTAAAAGVDAVLLSPDTVDLYNPKVLRGGMGAHFRLATADLAWTAIRDYCAGLTVYLADMEGDISYSAADWSKPWAVIIGSEARGFSAEAAALATNRVYIPMSPGAESLNAAIAAGIILFEARRQLTNLP